MIYLFLLAVLPLGRAYTVPASICDPIEDAFKKTLQNSKSNLQYSPCRCFESDSEEGMWIGCTGKNMQALFDAFQTTLSAPQDVAKVHIWDSTVKIVPKEFFQTFRPSTLIIEKSDVSLIRQGAFLNMAFKLKNLQLKNNQIKEIDATLFSELQRLEKLDMSRNKLTSLSQYQLSTLKEVTELNLAKNEIASIEDGAFSHIPKLRRLSLRGNKLASISNATFKGLTNLEELDLSDNGIKSIDLDAFADLKQLKWLDLGTNSLSALELRGLSNLERLLLNNNSIDALKKISLRDLPALNTLTLDRNQLTTIRDTDFFQLSTSPLLSTVSLTANNISYISPHAFEPLGSTLTVLSLQNNKLKSLSLNGRPWLAPLRKVERLLLSGNWINILKDGELPHSVKRLALDHNQLTKIDRSSFEGLRLSHLYLNNNHLQHLPEGTFDSLTNETLQVIDISFNDWQCLCGEEWLGKWLNETKEKDVAVSRNNGCLSSNGCELAGPKDDEEHSTWITLIAGILAAVSVVILLVIAYLFVEEGKPRSLPPSKEHKARGINSDRLRLINDRENADVVVEKKNGVGSRKVRFNENES